MKLPRFAFCLAVWVLLCAHATACQPPTDPSESSDQYVVIFEPDCQSTRSAVLARPGVRFVQDTVFGVEEVPAIIIAVTANEAEQIEALAGVFEVAPISGVDVRMPSSD